MSGSGTMVTLFLRIHSKVFPTYASNSFCSIPRSVSYSRFAIHDATNGAHPTSVSFMKMTPPRDTVAGDASRMFSISRRRRMGGVSGMRSLDARVSVLLSSITVFMLSIQIASTGPSQMIHFLSSFVSLEHMRTIVERIPSVHSCVFSSKEPYSCPIVIAFGFMITRFVVTRPGRLNSLHAHCASASTLLTSVFPPPVGPTSISPCRTVVVSYSWMHLDVKAATGWRLLVLDFSSIISMSFP
mmetsp:Transcript_37224/g.88179  ORF Transcript_37224/g.88179 Transcript_37224/m.88179 type:complete len:242 (-) Transcript_37224:575-1300(-)